MRDCRFGPTSPKRCTPGADRAVVSASDYNVESMNSGVDMAYKCEQELVDHFLEVIDADQSPWGPLVLVPEFFYHRGRVDVVGVSPTGRVIAFEAKLTRWREALQQAYRNTCFAHMSYVLLPRATARIAQQYSIKFDRRRVGLCSLGDGNLIVVHDSPTSEPIQPWLTEEACARAMEAQGG